jgi:tRNA G10  N-methylase Trm11
MNCIVRGGFVKIERVWAMPNKNTFDIKPIRELLEYEMCDGLWIDPFANKNKLATITNDLSYEYDTDYHLDALDFMKKFEDNSVDGVLYDPPYSPRQVSECYNNVGLNVTWDTTKASFWGNHKKEISRIVKKGGKVITFGWNSGGIGKTNKFDISRILLVPHGGWHNDTICTVEIKMESIKYDLDIEKSLSDTIVDKKGFEMQKELSYTDKLIIDKFKKVPTDFWDFKNEDTKELTHSIHTYPAVMVYPISRNIIRIIKELQIPINNLLDPFMGSGTVLVEGILSDIKTVYGSDLNPLARLISNVKTKLLNSVDVDNVVDELCVNIDKAYINYGDFISKINNYMIYELSLDLTEKNNWGSNAPHYMQQFFDKNNIKIKVPDFKNIGYWFKPSVIFELQIIKDIIKKVDNKDIQDFLWVAFSESIKLVSNRRNGEFKMYRMQALKVRNHNPNVREEFIKLLKRNVDKMKKFYDYCYEKNINSKVKIFANDTRKLEDIPDGEIELIITSPPYGDSRTTVAYGEFSRLSLQWIDLYEMSEKSIMSIDKTLMGGFKYRNGFELDLDSSTLRKSLERIKDIDIERAGDVYSFYKDMDMCLCSISKKMKVNSYQFWVVGNRTVKLENLKTDIIIQELGLKYGLMHVYTICRNIPNKVMPSLNSPSNVSGKKVSTMTNEYIVILRKV